MQFTPFLGILAGIIVTLIIIILTVIIVIKIKYKYGKQLNSTSSSANSETTDNSESSHYKSFKFDSDKKFLSNDSYKSECSSQSDSPLTDFTERSLRRSPGGRNVNTSQSTDKSRHNPVGESEGSRISVSQCDVTSWTPFLARDSAESVI